MEKPEGQVLEATFRRQLRLCLQMKDDVDDCARISGDDLRQLYPELYSTEKRQIERRRLQAHFDETTKFVAGGNATPVASAGWKKGGNGGDKVDSLERHGNGSRGRAKDALIETQSWGNALDVAMRSARWEAVTPPRGCGKQRAGCSCTICDMRREHIRERATVRFRSCQRCRRCRSHTTISECCSVRCVPRTRTRTDNRCS